MSAAVLDGLQAELVASGVDIGARAEIPGAALPEELPEEVREEVPGEAEGESVLDSAVPSEAEEVAVGGA